ncbi:MAG TPA: hypothetical protein VMB21_05165 [Candidatus Limnocylindria bacterium]|jgi:glyoxylase-like metal-dependent hydrolase (beta-lactamase superfamily II)|nr:hypothetical protein [Candidatus Limnocylindria bacterium]
MVAATSAIEILPGVHRWAAFSPAHKVELAAHSVWDGRTLLIFDPIPLAAEVFDWFPTPQAPDAVVLTNGNHERDTACWRALFPLAVWAAPEARPTLPGVRHWDSVAPPFPRWKIIPLPGGAPGESAWFCPAKSLVVFGDAVVNLAGRSLELLPAKYCEDQLRLRESLRDLPQFAHAVFAHGDPILGEASSQIAALL